MLHLDAAAVHARLDYAALIDALAAMFRDGCEMPVRHHHQVDVPDAPEGTLLLMPAWQSGGDLGVKVVTVFPGNADKGLPGVMGQYLLLDGTTGAPRALLDGTALTVRRTAAASALAARHLAPEDAASLLMIGTGALAPHLIQAHATVRPLRRVTIWGRRADRAKAVADEVRSQPALAGVTVDALDRPAAELGEAVAAADIVSCATLSPEPLVRGAWLRPGQHVDLVGAFRPDMRESDDDAVRRADIYVDTRGGALKEGGDLAMPLAAGVIEPGDIRADLADLCRGEAPGRTDPAAITLFKSVGAALEDLAAAQLAVDQTAVAGSP